MPRLTLHHAPPLPLVSALRRVSGLTQSQLADAAGVSLRVVQRAEDGEAQRVTLLATLGALGVTWEPGEAEAVAEALEGGRRVRVVALEISVEPEGELTPPEP